jgi:hypothetical protein
MTEGILPEKLTVEHIGERRQGMPHIIMRFKYSAWGFPGYSGLYVRIFSDVFGIVVADKAVVPDGLVCGKRRCDQHRACYK